MSPTAQEDDVCIDCIYVQYLCNTFFFLKFKEQWIALICDIQVIHPRRKTGPMCHLNVARGVLHCPTLSLFFFFFFFVAAMKQQGRDAEPRRFPGKF
jgi:hypothetical protein